MRRSLARRFRPTVFPASRPRPRTLPVRVDRAQLARLGIRLQAIGEVRVQRLGQRMQPSELGQGRLVLLLRARGHHPGRSGGAGMAMHAFVQPHAATLALLPSPAGAGVPA